MSKSQSSSRLSNVSSVLFRTRSILRQHLWIWPLLAAVILVFVAVWVRGRMEAAIKTQISSQLQTILSANREALRAWVGSMKTQVEFFAQDMHLRSLVTDLATISQQSNGKSALLGAQQQATLRAMLKPAAEGRGFNGFVVLSTNFLVLASMHDQLIGMESPPGNDVAFEPSLQQGPIVTHPFPSVALLTDSQGKLRTGVPTMFAVAPIHGVDGKVVAMLGLRIVPEKDFTRILATARAGETGETYAFNSQGLMLSESRFDDQLKQLTLIPDAEDSHSILSIELRDPMVDLTKGKASSRRRADMPSTRAVASATAGNEGVDVNGYRDYRGVPVVGAWTWLPDLNLGLVTEMDVAEAFHPLWIIRKSLGFIFALLVLGAVAIFLLMRLANRLQDSARKAVSKAKQLGQYALESKIGAGAFGTVYRGRHAMMRRPVAVKLLDTEQATENSIARFEREVQLTCQLTHPNTISIYDYGRTPEGIFYYAMELLEGLSLHELIQKHGRLPEERAIHILRQACDSLAEAHEKGLIHRDVKPDNIFLTRRGNIPDFVKVLDFGLVKARNTDGQVELTGGNVTLGTPLYMSPEAVEQPQNVNAQSDLYSLGAVGFYLVTGETLFFGATVGEVLLQQVRNEPEKPSTRLQQPFSTDFEELLMCCLAKKPAQRPASARELERALSHCATASQWGRDEAETWWKRFDNDHAESTLVLSK